VLIEGTCFKFERFQETSVEGTDGHQKVFRKNTEGSSPFETESVKSSERNSASSHDRAQVCGKVKLKFH
jgi:hypothetical protein